jgi:magnesium-transporting ATPase (P-type)
MLPGFTLRRVMFLARQGDCKKMRLFADRSPTSGPNPEGSGNHRTATEDERRLVELCTMPMPEALEALGTAAAGLDSEEAGRRMDEYGPNEMPSTKRLGFRADILHRFRSPLVIQLFVIAVVSGVIGEMKSAVTSLRWSWAPSAFPTCSTAGRAVPWRRSAGACSRARQRSGTGRKWR